LRSLTIAHSRYEYAKEQINVLSTINRTMFYLSIK
jgi:hypothetical protein